MMKKILFLDNTAWGLYNFRETLLRHYITNGYQVSVCVPYDQVYFEKFTVLGCTTIPIKLESRGNNPLPDLKLLYQYLKIMRKIKPDLLISYTIKPNIYGGLAASLLRIPYLPIVPGAGTVFQEISFVTHIVEFLYKKAFRKAQKVFFLNEDDLSLFLRRNLVPKSSAHRLYGEGIDLTSFSLSQNKEHPNFTFILVARLLKAKGIIYYHDAAKIVKNKFPNTRFLLLGMMADDNSDAITKDQLDQWNEEGVVSYLGATSDVASFLRQSDCLVLPSYYREGIPRSLMEGAAMGMPLITTDHVGCREVVEDSVNGLLCKICDVQDLAEKMEMMILLPFEKRLEMGRRGRDLMEKRFDINLIIDQYDKVVNDIFNKAK